MTKKKELSPELKAECDAAKALFMSKKNSLGITQASLAAAADISSAAVAMYLNGTNPLNAKFASVLSRQLGVPVEKFSKRLAKEINGLTSAPEMAVGFGGSAAEIVRNMLAHQGKGLTEDARRRLLAVAEADDDGALEIDYYRPGAVGDEVWIAHYDVRAAMGGGQIPHDYPEMFQDVRVSPQHLREMGVEFKEHFHLKMVTGWGQSMAPTIKHRDPLLVDVSVREFAGDGIYMFSWEGHLYIKRLQWLGDEQINMLSDNPRHPPLTIRAEDTYIQARVLLVWNAHLL
ncbi:S24 family peptidase [Pseudomonas vancouverensis]|uniref:S24 family peptidase n=1 Tax=Pseudomonas vancouverensis TaxID=95300 RepID=A0A1H2N8M0_PSEVA|nr:S24 family peptidase [Pseudomonas vancouverensis]KAB0493998.1 S24 family peptidase [Pseudomonas vancouverensis]TDB67590.1 S24 family peptidase [Pseudomonas vancouverensis]SDV01511.1 Helix-turn-helix [Pseudomonas vancouverensis]